MLEIFLIKVTLIPFLYHSNEFQSFIRGPADFLRTCKEFKSVNFANIAEKFQQNFENFSENQESEDIDNQFEESLKFFKGSLENMENFEDICAESCLTFEEYAKKSTEVLYGVNEINTFYHEKYNSKAISVEIRDECTNPYQILLEWAQAEVLDLKSIIIALGKKTEITKLKIKAEEKVVECKNKLEKAKSGKKSWKDLLVKQTTEEKISKIEMNLAEFQKDLDHLKFIEHLLNVKLYMNDIPQFKIHKADTYENILKNFINTSVEEFESLIQQARQIDFLYTFTH